MAAPDRLELLAAQTELTGLDFIFVHEDQTRLDLHFIVDPSVMAPAFAGTLTEADIIIRPAEREDDDYPISGLSWPVVDGRQVLRIDVPFPGGFEDYLIEIDSPRIDDWYRSLRFSFKANCESGLDCRPRGRCCSRDEDIVVDIDTTARDFWGLRAALMDFAAQRWPDWKDRLAADVGVMVAELFAALGDEFAYIQDQVSLETRFDTARELRSLRQMARLVDYEIDDGAAASGWISVEATAGGAGNIAAGTPVQAPSDTGNPVVFEIGNGLAEVEAGRLFPVDAAANVFTAYIWEEDLPEAPEGEVPPLWPPGKEVPASCLPEGATEMWLEGHHAAAISLTDIPADPAAPLGRYVLLRTDPPDASLPMRRWIVRVVAVDEELDELNGDAPVTRIRWEEAQALPFDFDLEFATAEGNVLPVTAGRTHSVRFAAGAQPLADPTLPRTVEREGPGDLTRHLFTLPLSDTLLMTRFGGTGEAIPEILLFETEWNAGLAEWQRIDAWEHRRSLMGVNASLPDSTHFTLDDGVWRPIVRHWRDPADYVGRDDAGGPPRFEAARLVHYDLAIGNGATIRFGTNDFGRVPAEGTAFECVYRLGGGRPTNVARDTITEFADAPPAFVAGIYNPLPTKGGRDRESIDRMRRLAPSFFKTLTYRAVIEADYTEAGERLDWVQAAGARFRDTGSYLTLFATADPERRNALSAELARGLHDHLDRFRQTGRQLHVVPPRFADIDLEITVCVALGYFRGDVKQRVLEALFGTCDAPGFFSPDNFSFGVPLYRSALEAVIQSVEGVRAVEETYIRRRGVFDWKLLDAPYEPARADEIIRIANDPLHPEWGLLTFKMEGGS
ncbi:hypothetical protein [Nitratireductor sp. XY-223]|uniref:hypothetical protein n=1 Tax=Nitratireductor sp. XY-223 TaxID=2561926 RepID=UPI0010AA9D68|nr:hypothetical protein [Nitratireductor sp. XY-223]